MLNSHILIFVATLIEKNALFPRFRCEKIYGFIFSGVMYGKKTHILVTGIGKKHISTRISKYKKKFPDVPSLIIITGLSGGLKPGLQTGDVINVKVVSSMNGNKKFIGADILSNQDIKKGSLITVDKSLNTPREKKTVYDKTLRDIVDMETFYILDEWKPSPPPYIVLRVVSDSQQDRLPEIAMVWGQKPILRVFRILIKTIIHPVKFYNVIVFNKKVHSALKSLKKILEKIFVDLKAGNGI